ncbi:nitric oxide synthase oxygenase, partial [Staphylococcus aureus]
MNLVKQKKYTKIKKINLKMYAVPKNYNIDLKIGGLLYTKAPNNRWYIVKEICVT